ncbi:hypothetical protein [Flavobacterium sp. FlaQc-50]|uniref:hypothetical protein n=1 Tax=unclassified Flavobacterium TaxID=196869 RepID=UPI00375677F6
MKKLLLFLVLIVTINVSAQATTWFSKPLELDKVPVSTSKADSVLVRGTDKILKTVPKTQLLTDVMKKSGDETKTGKLTLSDQLILGEQSGSPQELLKLPASSSIKYNNTQVNQYDFNITTLGADSFFWLNDEGHSRQCLLYADADSTIDSDVFGLSASQDDGLTWNKTFSITQGGQGYLKGGFTSNRIALTDNTYNYKQYLSPIRNNLGGFYNSPFFASDYGYYSFRPSINDTPSRFYIMPNGTTDLTPVGTTSKFEMFNMDYSVNYTQYTGFNVFLENVNNTINIGPNRGALGGNRMKMRIAGDYTGSQFLTNSSLIDFNTDDSININPFKGAVSVGTDVIDPFGIATPNQFTFKNPLSNSAARLNVVGNNAAAGLYLGRDGVRTASFATQGTTSDAVIATNPTNTGTGLTENFRVFASNGAVVIQHGGTFVNNLIDKLKVDGSILATQFKISALNTAPASATASGTLGEIRITATYIYICTATNTWVRSSLATW